MPPRKQPKSLHELSLKTLARLTMELCVNIERKHGGRKCQARRDELAIGRMYLSSIQLLFDDLLKVVLDMYFKIDLSQKFRPLPKFEKELEAKSLILKLLICDKLSTLDSSQIGSSNKSTFWKNQFLKLKNVVNLDIVGIRLTDKSFRAIGDVCTNVRKLSITFDSDYASPKSLKHILKCGELRKLRIEVSDCENDEVHEYLGMLATGLPKLEHLDTGSWLNWEVDRELSATKQLTSMRKIKIKSGDLAEIILQCPNLTDLEVLFDDHCLFASDRPSLTDRQNKVLNVLAESSLQLTSLKLDKASLSKELSRVISCKGAHLTSLDIIVGIGKRISVNDVYTIGVSCPEIVELRFSLSEEWMYPDEATWPAMEEKTFVSTPRMFVGLKVLELECFTDWDQRIVPLILRHAVNLTSVSLIGVFSPSTSNTSSSVDPLSQILDANALQQLESLHIQAESYDNEDFTIPFTKASIERLLDCCNKLAKLYLKCPMEDKAIDYLQAQQSCLKSENYDFTLDFDPVA